MSTCLRVFWFGLLFACCACTGFEQMVGIPTPTLAIQKLAPTSLPPTPVVAPTYTAQLRGIPEAALQHKVAITGSGPHLTLNFYGETVEGTRFISIDALEIYESGTGLRLQSFHDITAKTPTDGVMLKDINFDGYMDIMLTAETSGGPNIKYLYWLYTPQTDLFTYHPNLTDHLISPVFDANTQRAHSYERLSAEQAIESIYQWEPANRLVLVQRNQVTFTDDTSETLHWVPFSMPASALSFEHPETWHFTQTDIGYQAIVYGLPAVTIEVIPIAAGQSFADEVAQSARYAPRVVTLVEAPANGISRYDAQTNDASLLSFFHTDTTIYAFSLKSADMTASQLDRIVLQFDTLLRSVTQAP